MAIKCQWLQVAGQVYDTLYDIFSDPPLPTITSQKDTTWFISGSALARIITVLFLNQEVRYWVINCQLYKNFFWSLKIWRLFVGCRGGKNYKVTRTIAIAEVVTLYLFLLLTLQNKNSRICYRVSKRNLISPKWQSIPRVF